MQCNQDTIDCPIQANTSRTISSKASISATETNNANKRNYRRKIKRKTVATVSNQQSTGREEKWSISFLFLLFVADSFDTSESMFGRSYSHVVAMFNMRQKNWIVLSSEFHIGIIFSLLKKDVIVWFMRATLATIIIMLNEHQRCLCFSACMCVSFYACISRSFDSNV